MRVTQNSSFIPFQSSIEDIQLRLTKEQARMSSGKQIISISDAPKDIVDVKKLSENISRNEQYQNNIGSALQELMSVSDILDSTIQKFTDIRNIALDATQTGNIGNLPVLATSIQVILQDIIKDANSDFNGKLLFSGTKTTLDSITPTPPQTNSSPFELIKDTPTATNPSGFIVVFKGNVKDIEIQKDSKSTEVINTKANEIFGTGGTSAMQNVIDLYNLLMYKSDGSKRTDKDLLNKEDLGKLDAYQKNITDNLQKMESANSINGSRINRLQAVTDQITSENIRLNEVKSKLEDTDVAQTAINLARENTALQYTLQVGSKLVQQSLFDFLR